MIIYQEDSFLISQPSSPWLFFWDGFCGEQKPSGNDRLLYSRTSAAPLRRCFFFWKRDKGDFYAAIFFEVVMAGELI